VKDHQKPFIQIIIKAVRLVIRIGETERYSGLSDQTVHKDILSLSPFVWSGANSLFLAHNSQPVTRQTVPFTEQR